jgi:hypothetical protein
MGTTIRLHIRAVRLTSVSWLPSLADTSAKLFRRDCCRSNHWINSQDRDYGLNYGVRVEWARLGWHHQLFPRVISRHRTGIGCTESNAKNKAIISLWKWISRWLSRRKVSTSCNRRLIWSSECTRRVFFRSLMSRLITSQEFNHWINWEESITKPLKSHVIVAAKTVAVESPTPTPVPWDCISWLLLGTNVCRRIWVYL